MLARILAIFAALILVIAMVGCEGDEGPTGPAGPAGATGPAGADGQDGQDGDTVVLAFGVIDASVNPPVVVSSWPPSVTVTLTDVGLGLTDMTLDGTFPATEGTVIGTISETNAGRSMTAYASSWSDVQIELRVGTWDVINDAWIDVEFSYVILGQ